MLNTFDLVAKTRKNCSYDELSILRTRAGTFCGIKGFTLKQNSASHSWLYLCVWPGGTGNSWCALGRYCLHTRIHTRTYICRAILYRVWKAIYPWQQAYRTAHIAAHDHLSLDSESTSEQQSNRNISLTADWKKNIHNELKATTSISYGNQIMQVSLAHTLEEVEKK